MTGRAIATGVELFAPLAVWAYLAVLLHRLRRAGRPNRGGERMVAAWLGASTASAAIGLVWPSAAWWVRWLVMAPALLVGFVFWFRCVTDRAVFGPKVARRRGCRGHR